MAGSPPAVGVGGLRNVSPGPSGPLGPPGPLRPTGSSPQFPHMPGYMPAPGPAPGARFPAPGSFPTSVRPTMYRPPMALPAPPAGSVVPQPRPPIGIRPLPLKPPGIPDPSKVFGGPYEKPYTTVYVGKIAPTVDDTFLRSLLQLCGPIKSWKRAHDPTAGGPKGFGFCEFEHAEGVLRATRLLNKYNLDGQELVLNVTKDTQEYLERYVAAKENDKLLEEAAQEEDTETAPGVEVSRKKSDPEDKTKFGLVTEMDKKGDEDALARMKTLFDERVRCRPIYRPSLLDGRPQPARERSKEPDDTNGRHEKESSVERLEKIEPSSSDRNKRDRQYHRDDDDRYVRDRDRERSRRNMKHQHRDHERVYEDHEREWEAREREKDRQRLHDREREKERERERKREIKEQEEEENEIDGKKRRYRPEDRRRRRQREREDDIADAAKEAEEIVEAKRRKLELELQNAQHAEAPETDEKEDVKMEIDSENESPSANGEYESTPGVPGRNDSEVKPSVSKKLGFGISGTGKRATVPAVFHQGDEEDMREDRKLRPLVPIDYSAEEMQAVRAKRSPSTEDDRKDGRRHKDRSRRDRDRDRDRDRGDVSENPKIQDAKQLIDSIPKKKEELFSYPINWAIYDKHKLHEKMRPWISKKITEYLGEEETSFVDFIVTHTCNHVTAEVMLDKLHSILDEEAELFVLKMWRMLIFEIRRIETGLAKPSS